ncbi:threonine ammonia-lyase [Kineococcus sp. SYSU DK004]|uniref:threonine ammonia-lyase n=1 Tax=Kineococcus sp. SYSU DK004 TaxID=3383125 RepID=UPI003D7DF01C
MSDDSALDLDSIVDSARAARHRIRAHLRRTALEPSPAARTLNGADVLFKHEHQQVTGSFKPRGALTKLSAMSPAEADRGVVAPTAGNHGIGVAYAGARIGVPVSVYLPASADESKRRQIEAHGATVKEFADVEAARTAAVRDARRTGATYSSAYDDADMVVGAATLGLELVDELPDVDVVVLPIGGGGLAAGVGAAFRVLRPRTRVWAVAPRASPTWSVWHGAAEPSSVRLGPSIAEGISGPIEPTTLTFPLVNRVVDRVVEVTDAEIAGAVQWLAADLQQLVEPSGAAAAAAVVAGRHQTAGARTAVVLTGRNVSLERFRRLTGPRRVAADARGRRSEETR